MKVSMLAMLASLVPVISGCAEDIFVYRSATVTVVDHAGYDFGKGDHAVMADCSWSLAPGGNPMVLTAERLHAVSEALDGVMYGGHGTVSHTSKGVGFGTTPMPGTKGELDARIDRLLDESFRYPPLFTLRKQLERPVTMKTIGPDHHAEAGPGTIVGYTYSYDLLAGGRPVFNGRVTLNVSAEGVRSIAYVPVVIDPATLASVSATDPALAFRKAAPRLDEERVLAGNCVIKAVTLGYLLLDGKSGKDSAMLVPAWRFDVERDDPSGTKRVHQIHLHAVDGRLLEATGQR